MTDRHASPLLLQPLSLRGMTARNRIWLAPMCQYSCLAQDGVPTDWHLVHLGARASGGFGLLMTEATAVVAEGRISLEDTGMWSDGHIAPWRRIVAFVHEQGALLGMQLGHAGRKASTYAPFAPESGSVPLESGGWETVGPTETPFTGLRAPRSMTASEIAAVPREFAAAARRADEAGFDVLEVHAAHGYLLHQFLSPLVNQRADEYGGSFGNRTRLVLEVVDSVRSAWPDHKALFVRLSATDWAAGGWDVDEAARLGRLLRDHGVDLIDVSSGGAVAEQEIVVGPGYQSDFARRIRRVSGGHVSAVGMITAPRQAEALLEGEAADAIMLGRGALREPAWPWRAAHELGVPSRLAPYPAQYERGAWG